MSSVDVAPQPLPPERSLYMQRAASHAVETLKRLSTGTVEYGPISLQLLDEWIDRVARRGPLPGTARVLVIAFLGQTFLHKHGGYWAVQRRGQTQSLGVVCPVAGSEKAMRFIDIVDQVNRRLAHGIRESLTFFYLTTSVDLQGRT
jgi:hypothetical protein